MAVRKDLDCLPKNDPQQIIERIESLAENPRPLGCEKLSGQEKYRLRQGNHRIIYSIKDTQLTIWKVGHRREVYRV